MIARISLMIATRAFRKRSHLPLARLHAEISISNSFQCVSAVTYSEDTRLIGAKRNFSLCGCYSTRCTARPESEEMVHQCLAGSQRLACNEEVAKYILQQDRTVLCEEAGKRKHKHILALPRQV